MIYYCLQAVSTAIFGAVAVIWMIEENLINLMMNSFLILLRLACHPLMVVPTLIGVYLLIRKLWLRRRSSPVQDGGELSGYRPMLRTPRLCSYRSRGSVSSRSNDSFDEEDEVPLKLRSERS